MRLCKHTCKFGGTALHFAVHREHEDVVELLLEAYADPDLKEVIYYMVYRVAENNALWLSYQKALLH